MSDKSGSVTNDSDQELFQDALDTLASVSIAVNKPPCNESNIPVEQPNDQRITQSDNTYFSSSVEEDIECKSSDGYVLY